MERKAFELANGKIPVQKYIDYKNKSLTVKLGKIEPQLKGGYAFADLNNVFPEYIRESLLEAIESFGKDIKGFDDDDAILSAVESRTSSPVRIERDDKLLSNVNGVYPCGEGAGYAGGIVSAAVDGIKVFEQIFEKYTVKSND